MLPTDMVAIAILGIAALRGLWIGAIREVFSLAALACACIALLAGTGPTAEWLLLNSPVELSPLAAKVLAGAAIAVGVIAVIALIGRIVQSGARAVGLGFADRLAGGVLGAAEGALLVGLLLFLGLKFVGRDEPLLAQSRTLDLYQRVEEIAQDSGIPVTDVAAPPPERER